MKIESIEGAVATAAYAGGEYRVRVDLVDARIGDYVLVHAGIAITTMGEDDARETLELLKQIDDINRSLPRSGDGGPPGRGDPA
jgi:hydrogenase expression/formation protein HypC